MKYDICIHTGASKESVLFFLKIKDEFLKYNFKVQLYTLNRDIESFVGEKDLADFVVFPEISDFYDIEESVKFVKSLGINNYASLYFTQKTFHNLNEKKAEVITAKKIQTLKTILNKPKAELYFTFAGDEVDINIFRLFAKHQGGKLIYSGYVNLGERIFVTDNEKRYFDIPKSPETIPNEEINWIEEYINKMIENKPILWGSPKELDVKVKAVFFVKLFKRLFKKKNTTKNTSFIINRFVSRLYYRFVSRFYYSKNAEELLNKPFVYFPLHYPKDSQLTLRGLPFFKQQDIVEIVSRYVPYDYNLIVKEHPLARGYSKVNDIKRMAKLPRTFVLHPLINSHDIIRNAKAVIVINSSVGYEAMIYSKPVITLGNSFYRGHGLSYDVESLYDLEKAFEEIRNFVPNRDILLQFLWKNKKFSYPINHNLVFKSSEGFSEEYVRILLPVLKKFQQK